MNTHLRAATTRPVAFSGTWQPTGTEVRIVRCGGARIKINLPGTSLKTTVHLNAIECP